MQKKRFLIVPKTRCMLFTLLLSAAVKAQTITKEHQVVQQTIIQLFDALSNRDSVSLKAHSTADITLYEYGQVWNMDTLILKAITLNSAADFKRTNVFDFIHTSTDKNSAWVTYRLNSTMTRDGKHTMIQWLETVELAKQKIT